MLVARVARAFEHILKQEAMERLEMCGVKLASRAKAGIDLRAAKRNQWLLQACKSSCVLAPSSFLTASEDG